MGLAGKKLIAYPQGPVTVIIVMRGFHFVVGLGARRFLGV